MKIKKASFLITIIIFLIISHKALCENEEIDRINKIADINKKAIELANKKEYKKAISMFIDVIAEERKILAKLYHNVGFTYERYGKILEAIRSYELAIKENPFQEPSYYNVLKLYWEELKADPEKYCNKIFTTYKEFLKLVGSSKMKKRYKDIIYIYENAKDKCFIKPKKEKLGISNEVYIEPSLPINIYKSNNKFVRKTLPNTLLGINYLLFAEFQPDDKFSISITSYLPSFGYFMEGLLYNIEKIETLIGFTGWKYGFGVMVSHSKDLNQTDIKLGFITGFKSKEKEIKAYFYSRYIVGENTKSTGIKYDIDNFGLYYKRESKGTGYKVSLDYFEYFLYNFESNADYKLTFYGILDINLKYFIALYKGGTKKQPKYYGIYLGLGDRIYFYHQSNSPFTFGDGCGYFGLSPKNIPYGEAMPGFSSNSIVFMIGFFYKKYYRKSILTSGILLEYEITSENITKNEMRIKPFIKTIF